MNTGTFRNVLVLSIVLMSSISSGQEHFPATDDPVWGEAKMGLQMRVVSVSQTTDEQRPD